MRRTITVGLLIFACFLLQSSVFTRLDLGGITPNLLIVLTASFGFMRGEKEGMFIGFICGLLMDIFFAEYMGLYSLIYLYIGFFNGKFKKIFYPDDIKLPISLIIFSDLIYGLALTRSRRLSTRDDWRMPICFVVHEVWERPRVRVFSPRLLTV